MTGWEVAVHAHCRQGYARILDRAHARTGRPSTQEEIALRRANYSSWRRIATAMAEITHGFDQQPYTPAEVNAHAHGIQSSTYTGSSVLPADPHRQ